MIFRPRKENIKEAAAIDIEVKPGTFVVGLVYVSEKSVALEELQQTAAESLAAYKRPRVYHTMDKLPRNANGKLLRKPLRERYRLRDDEA